MRKFKIITNSGAERTILADRMYFQEKDESYRFIGEDFEEIQFNVASIQDLGECDENMEQALKHVHDCGSCSPYYGKTELEIRKMLNQ